MTPVLLMFCVQCALGAFDNLWHHEIQARLPSRRTARTELALHTTRELIYGAVFFGVAWWRWEGLWTSALVALLGIEIVVTLCDFLEEDRSRRLPPLERVLHTVMAINYGALLALWAPELGRWMQSPTTLTATSYGTLSWLMTAFSIGVTLWGLRDLQAVSRLGVPSWQRHPMRAGTRTNPRTFLVTGGTGFVGTALVRSLVASGDRVIVLSRDPAQARDRFGPLVEVIDTLDRIASTRRIDTIVNLAGEPLAGGLWTAARKQRFLESRTGTSEKVIALIRRLETRPDSLICASAIGYYGDCGDRPLDEGSALGSGYLPELTAQCELATRPAQDLGVRVCWLRIGYVLGREGGMLRPLIPAVWLGGGTVLGNGRQRMSWIHIRDLVRLIEHAVARQDVAGVVNAVAPVATSQAVFTRSLASALSRPTLVRIPAGVLRRLLGDMADLLLASQDVAPRRALESGFTFDFENLQEALQEILKPSRTAVVTDAVYANFDCPVCSLEMDRYGAAAERCGAGIRFLAIADVKTGLETWGLTKADLRRRLFAVTKNGEMRSGIDAFASIWRQLPKYRWLARLVRLPLIRPIVELFYDLICAPLLTRWNEARMGRTHGRR